MISQQVFGECCEILEQTKDWSRVRCRYDGYEGWCQEGQLTEIDEPEFEKGGNALPPDWVNTLEYTGHHMIVPIGASLTAMKNGKAHWRKNQVQFKGKAWEPAVALRDAKSIRQLTYKFLNTPYLWGGK